MDFRLYGLIGKPLGHSFSVSYFSNKFSEEGINAGYRNFPLEEISDFELLVKEQSNLSGLNVTVPYKQKIIPYLDALAETARSIQAVNTICFCRKKGIHALVGHNTDVIGFERSLKEHLNKQHTSALVLGTGGSSKAVIFVLEKLGIPYHIVSRSEGENRVTYAQLENDLVAASPLIINTTPLGMHPELSTYPDIPYDAITPGHLLFDLVYNPEKTKFLSLGEEKGATIVNGYDMLVYQAEGSWEIWNKGE
ncbi:MAG: shikimate dehydrogenase [Bacteroidota bacterium]